MDALERRLASHTLVGLDTSIFIYHLEAHPTYLPLTKTLLAGIQSGRMSGVSSVITVMELTVQPWRQQKSVAAREYEAFLAYFPYLQLVDTTRSIARSAARLRAIYNLRPADALQVATAYHHQATAFVTNDAQLRRLSSLLDVIILDDFV